MKKNHTKNKRLEGFGLIEIITAIGLITLLIVSSGKSFALFNNLKSMNQLHFIAESYAVEPLEIFNKMKNDIFACRCEADSCSANVCLRISDNQSCNLSPGFSSCYTEYPKNKINENEFYFKKNGSTWELETTEGAGEIISGNENFSRKIIIQNLNRNSLGQIDPNGNPDSNTKMVTAIVQYHDSKISFSHTLSAMFTAWKNL